MPLDGRGRHWAVGATLGGRDATGGGGGGTVHHWHGSAGMPGPASSDRQAALDMHWTLQ